MKILHRKQLRVSLGFLNWSQEDLAKKSGVSLRSITRWCHGTGEIRGHARKIQTVVFALESGGCNLALFDQSRVPLISVDLPFKLITNLGGAFAPIRALAEIGSETQTHECVISRIRRVTERVTSVHMSANEIFFEYIGKGIR